MSMVIKFSRRIGGAGFTGLILTVSVLILALCGPLLLQSHPNSLIGPAFGPPEPGHPLGFDLLGRDVWSRLLAGGQTTILLSAFGVAATYLVGLPLGVISGLYMGRIDTIIMRIMDVVLAFPSLLFLLVLAAAHGAGITVVFIAIIFGNVAWLTRIVRAATSEIAPRGYVDAARLRGETLWSIIRREVVPNISGTLASDLGMRFTTVILFVAGASYLGIGVRPPDADWARMVAENMSGLAIAPLVVLAPVTLITALTVGINLFADSLDYRSSRKASARGGERRAKRNNKLVVEGQP